MLGSHLLQAAESVKLIDPASLANTAAATSGWIDVRKYEGDLMFVIQAGAVTGSMTSTFEDATDGSGTGAAAIVPNEGNPAVINSANQVRKCTINAGATRGWVRHVGTIVTGPVLGSVSMHAHPKYT